MNKEFKITHFSKNKYYYKVLLTTLLIHITILSGYFYFEKINEFYLIGMIFLGVFFGWLLIFALPVSLLYFNYYRHCKDVIFNYNDSEGIFVYTKLSESFTFTMKDVTKVELHMTSTAYEKRTDWLYYGKFHYISIHTLQKRILIVSCLVCDKAKEIFPEKLIIKSGKFLPLIPKLVQAKISNG